jgi:hypothetical protein
LPILLVRLFDGVVDRILSDAPLPDLMVIVHDEDSTEGITLIEEDVVVDPAAIFDAIGADDPDDDDDDDI